MTGPSDERQRRNGSYLLRIGANNVGETAIGFAQCATGFNEGFEPAFFHRPDELYQVIVLAT